MAGLPMKPDGNLRIKMSAFTGFDREKRLPTHSLPEDKG